MHTFDYIDFRHMWLDRLSPHVTEVKKYEINLWAILVYVQLKISLKMNCYIKVTMRKCTVGRKLIVEMSLQQLCNRLNLNYIDKLANECLNDEKLWWKWIIAIQWL